MHPSPSASTRSLLRAVAGATVLTVLFTAMAQAAGSGMRGKNRSSASWNRFRGRWPGSSR